jgi:hypothetical protein
MQRKSNLRGLLRALVFAVASCWLSAGCASMHDCSFPWKHGSPCCEKEPLTVAVTGLVKQQVILPIPRGGLQLKDAVALAGGDIPAQLFNGLSPSQVVVTLARPEAVYHIALPLITNDIGGRIFLVPGDKVSLELGSNTDIGRSVVRSASADVGQNIDQWRSILGRDDIDKKTLAYDVTFHELNGSARKLTVNVQATSAPVDAGRSAAAPAGQLAPVSTVKIQFADTTNLPGLRSADGTPHDATLLALSDFSESPQTNTVMVLERRLQGRSHHYVLARPGSLSTTSDQRSVATSVLNAITVIPEDVVSASALIQLPIVMRSLAHPKLYDFAAQQDECCPKLSAECRSIAATLSPIVDPIKRVAALTVSSFEGMVPAP